MRDSDVEELTSESEEEDEDLQSEVSLASLDSEEVSSEDISVLGCKDDKHIKEDFAEEKMKGFLYDIERAWDAVYSLTGLMFGIIPPKCTSPTLEPGHWIKLSRDVIPFVYVTSDNETIRGEGGLQMGLDDVRTRVYSALLLISTYVNSVIKKVEGVVLQKEHKFTEMLKHLKSLHSSLQSLMTDFGSLVVSSTEGNTSIIISKHQQLTTVIDEICEIDRIDIPLNDDMVTVTESELLANILGLGRKLKNRLISVNEEKVINLSPFSFIKKGMEDKMKNKHILLQQPQITSDPTSTLLLMGFSREKSQEIANAIGSQKDEPQTPIACATQYLEQVFSAHPLLTMLSFHARYANQETNQWLEATAEQLKPGALNPTILNFKLYCVVSEGDNAAMTAKSIDAMFGLEGHTLLFHGAKNAVSLDLILRQGITLSYGGRRQDFSHKNGFYLSDHFKAAKKLATRKGNPPNAVIVYLVPDNLLCFGEDEGLDLNEDRHLWSRVVRYHRSGYKVDQDVPDEANLHNRTFLRGPVCRLGYCSKINGILPTIKISRKIEAMQYCIRSEKFALEISSFVAGIVVFN